MNRKFQLLALLVLVQVTMCAEVTPGVAPADLKVTKVGIADSTGETVATIIKVIQIIAFVMLLADCFARYKGTPLYFGHALRFIFFIYGACCPWLLGGNEDYAPLGYRDLGDKLFFHFFDQIYHGYFGFGYINCFNHRLTVDGAEYGFLYINILFFEALGFFILKTAAWASDEGIARKDRFSNLMASLAGMYLEFFAFPFAGWAVFFFKQHFVMVDLEDEGKTVSGRNDTVYWMSMILAIWMTFEVARSCYELFEGNRDIMKELPKEDSRIKEGQQQVPNTGRSDVSVNSTQKIAVKTNRTPDNCTYDALYAQYWLFFQYHHQSAHNMLSQYYNTIWVMRWVVFAVFAIIWYKYPRTLYIMFLVINVLMIYITISIKKSFRWAFNLILVEEILITLWHLAALVNFLDYYGSQSMGQFFVNLTSHVMLWTYLATVIIETIMLFVGAFKHSGYFGAFPEAVAASEEIRIDIQSKDELEGKIDTYRTMKSQAQVAPKQPQTAQESKLPTLNGVKD